MSTEDNSRFRQFVDLVHLDAALDGVSYVVHRLKSKEADDHPRFAWIWRGGNVVENPEGTTIIEQPNCVVSCAYVDMVNAEIHIWGEDFSEAEQMRNDMLGALRRVLGDRLEITGYQWWNEQEATAEWDVSGAKCVLSVIVQLLIATEIKPAKQVADTEATVTFQDSPAGSSVEIVDVISVIAP